ncbi:MAG: hypothetical protein H0U10_00730 [Chloroflexia bacterium]|nr:hypothetical protein [Chloroflexia bacterium]
MSAASASESASTAPHVLIIEDDLPILTLFERSLEHAGLRVTSRETPDLEPAEIAALAPDVLVLDLLFDPRRRGFAAADLGSPFLDRLKADPATAALPVVVCSADVPRLRLLVARMASRSVVALAKPCRPSELVEAVRSCLLPDPPPLRPWPEPQVTDRGADRTRPSAGRITELAAHWQPSGVRP